MIRNNFKYLFLFLVLVLFSNPLFAKEPENLHTAKQAGIFYHDSGEYDVDLGVVAEDAVSYLESRISQNNSLPEPKKLAVVIDVDETAISNYEILLELNFAFLRSLLAPGIKKAQDPAIKPTLKLYDYAKDNGVAIFFITSRSEKLREVTEKNLKDVGYAEWNELFLKPNTYDKKSVIPFKRGARKSIQDEGYHIVVNIGDQFSDLAGGYSERTFKLPNPYYYVP